MANDNNVEKVVMLFEGQNKDVLRKLNQIERQTKKSFSRSTKAAKNFNFQMQKGAGLARTFATSLAGFGGVAVAGGLAGIASSARAVVADASELAKTADLIGVTTDALQRMQYGFGLAGVSVEGTEKSLEQFGKRLSEAEMKGGYLADILAANNIQLRDQEGRMRPMVDLLGDYAELIANAGSEQEKLSLANEAFGRSGSTMVLALRKGRDGMRELMRAADDAGGVLDEEILRRAEEIDDQFAALSRTIGTNLKKAVLSVADAVSSLVEEEERSGLLSGAAGRRARRAEREARSLAEIFGIGGDRDRDYAEGAAGRRQRRADRRPTEIAGPSGGADATNDNEPVQTVMPTRARSGGGAGGSRSSETEADKVQEHIEALELEYAAIGKSASQQRLMNELRSVGAGVTDLQKAKIVELVEGIEQATAKQEALTYVSQQFETVALNSFAQITSQIETGNDALDTFLQTMIQVAAQGAIFGTGPLAGLFGGGLSALSSGLFSAGASAAAGSGGLKFGGLYAKGGYLGAGQWGIAGENGPEPIIGPARVVPNKQFAATASNQNNAQQPIVMHVHGVTDAASFRQSEGQISAQLARAVARGRRNM